MRKAIVVGIDGLAWEILSKLDARESRKVLGTLTHEGVFGDLESTIPPVSAPAWVSFATGTNPGKHGVFDFVGMRNRQMETSLLHSNDIGAKTFYEIISKNGMKSILINLPFSTPPKDIKGIILSDSLSPDPYAFPNSASKYLRTYRHIHDFTKSGTDLISDVLDVECRKAEVAKEIFRKEEWDFFFVMFYGMDNLCHRFLQDILAKSRRGRRALLVLDKAMETIGWFMENIDDSTVMLIMSDHGFERKTRIVNMNRWLERKGFLKSMVAKDRDIRVTSHVFLSKRKSTLNIPIPQAMINQIMRFPLGRSLVILLFEKLFSKYLPGSRMAFHSEETLAFVPTNASSGIHINSTTNFEGGIIGSERDHETFLEELMEGLRELNQSDGGQGVFERIWRREELYNGEYTSFAPDIVLQPKDGVFLSATMGQDLEELENREIGHHAPKGVFFAYGESIRKGQCIESARIYDLAPTVLHILGIGIPPNMDGEVLKKIFREDSSLYSRTQMYVSMDEEDRIGGRIRRLKREGRV